MVAIHAVKYYTAIKRGELMLYSLMWSVKLNKQEKEMCL